MSQNYYMNNQTDNIDAWLEKADHDLGTAKIVFLHIPDYYDIIAFHCQQAVEKYIKAMLLYFDIQFLRSHDLVYLLDLLSEKLDIDKQKFKDAFTLNNYSTQIRYPNKIINLTTEDLKKSIEIAENFRGFCIITIFKKKSI